MRKITLKMVLMLGGLVVLIVSVAGCTSSPSSNQTAQHHPNTKCYLKRNDTARRFSGKIPYSLQKRGVLG
jgi:hypothetical protein